ncbi:MAG: DUF4215 domain-containing protein [bacterium]
MARYLRILCWGLPTLVGAAMLACGDDDGGGDAAVGDGETSVCGNEVVEGSEECDEGTANSDLEPDACRANCVIAHCGDGVIDTDEECDNGDRNSNAVPDGCRLDCTEHRCGDGVVDLASGETCDDGGTESGDGCSAVCVLEYCGNGVVDPNEVCDDGNAVAGDGCSPDCLSAEACPNGRPDFAAGETCDCGDDAGNLPPGCVAPNGVGDSPCDAACQSRFCGNMVIDTAAGEVCDDGNLNAGDGCSPDCLSDESCGNGRPDFATGETCDCGTDAGNLPLGCVAVNGDPNGQCSATCQIRYCGNGTVDASEVCDDGNNHSGDGCSADCLSDESCGNGYVDTATGELCDDGNNEEGDDCTADCTLPTCGDDWLDEGEVCDDGNRLSGDGCNALCSSLEACGDGIIDVEAGELCDDGNTADGDGCSSLCMLPYCSNGVVEFGEVCDDGNAVGGDGCSADCLSDETCGNGYVDIMAGEHCDDGNTVGGDGCTSCTVDPGWRCLYQPSQCALCGDGNRHPTVEPCDGANLGGQSCQSLGYVAGTLACNGLCTAFDTSGCTSSFCGDGTCDAGEDPTNCPQDCGGCGNGVCEAGETTVGCPGDCAWTQIAAGGTHTCGVRVDGSVWCFGQGTDGRLGDGNLADRVSPVKASGLTNAISVDVGSQHSCAQANTWELWCWGQNTFGQFGNGPTTSTATPTMVQSGMVSSFSTGATSTCIMQTNGSVICAGDNTRGQLGDMTNNASNVWVTTLGVITPTAVSVGQDFACSPAGSGNAYCWGANDYGQVGNNSTLDANVGTMVQLIGGGATNVDVGLAHACAATNSGVAHCWGYGLDGRLGQGTGQSSLVPVPVATLNNVSYISAGGGHACAIDSGNLWCWGLNDNGQLGINSYNNQNAPLQVAWFPGNVAAVSAGDYHTCAITTAGRAYCWGDAGAGQLGTGDTTDRTVPWEVLDP